MGFKSSRKDSRHAMFGNQQLFRVHSEGLLVVVQISSSEGYASPQ
jgi:hypothetical protein